MSKKYDSLGDRMKGYENIARNYLARRIPTIIRVDGKAFHTFTRGMEKPFDRILMTTMQNTMKYLCENIQGCVFGYTQSDEITLVLIPPVSAPSPITASTWLCAPFKSRAIAMPSAAEIEVLACPVPKAS